MGMWQTGYGDHVDDYRAAREDVFPPWESGPPIRYPCQVKGCSEIFDTAKQRVTHRFEKHPFKSPKLFVKGYELGKSIKYIVEPLKLDDIETRNCSRAWINERKIDPMSVAAELSESRNKIVQLQLESREQLVGNFQLSFNIADKDDLDAIDGCYKHFVGIVKNDGLDNRALEEFIKCSEQYHTAAHYRDGIHQYFLGVMAKEMHHDSHIPREEYIDKYNLALQRLEDYPTELSVTICSLVNFHFNLFGEIQKQESLLKVCHASRRYTQILSGGSEIKNCSKHIPLRPMEEELGDNQLLNIIDAACMPIDKFPADLDSMLSLEKGAQDFDRTKVEILLAEVLLWRGEKKRAREIAKGYRNRLGFRSWSKSLITRSGGE